MSEKNSPGLPQEQNSLVSGGGIKKHSPLKLLVVGIIILGVLIILLTLLSKNNSLKDSNQETIGRVDSNGVIDCGNSGDISKLPEIVDKRPSIFQVYPKDILDYEIEDCCKNCTDEATILKNCPNSMLDKSFSMEFATPRTYNFTFDKAIMCMDEALKYCKRARVVINDSRSIPGFLSSNNTVQYILESKGYNETGSCLVSYKERWDVEKSDNTGRDFICKFEPRHLSQEHSCGMYTNCSWRGQPGSMIWGLFGTLTTESLHEISGEQTYTGDPHCQLLS